MAANIKTNECLHSKNFCKDSIVLLCDLKTKPFQLAFKIKWRGGFGYVSY
jgi:hypothetical protein